MTRSLTIKGMAALMPPFPPGGENHFPFTVITGPRRRLARGGPAYLRRLSAT